MLHPLHAYLVVSVALGGTELGGTLKMGLKGMVESPHLVLKRGEDATLDEIGKIAEVAWATFNKASRVSKADGSAAANWR